MDECHGPPVRKRSGQLEETLNMKPAWKGWRMMPLTSLHLIAYIACVAQRNYKMSLGFTPWRLIHQSLSL